MKNSFKIIDWETNPSIIPQELDKHGGVYCIVTTIDFDKIKFKENNPKRKDKINDPEPYPIDKLKDKCLMTKNKERIIYIGKASRSLYKRLNQYMKYLYGKGNIHRGGRAIGQIKDFENILICKYETIDDKDPECYEKELLSKFKCKYGDYPLANWRL